MQRLARCQTVVNHGLSGCVSGSAVPHRSPRMATQFVVAVYDSYGIARDARNRLHTEGVPQGDVSLMVLRETAPPPPSLEPTLEAMDVDPLVFGNVRET